MDVRANLLACLCRSEDADHGDSRAVPLLSGAMLAKEWRVEATRRGLVMVDAVEPDSEARRIQIDVLCFVFR